MANIDNELQSIMNAVYGRDVRQSIHDGIKAVNDSATDSAAVCETKATAAATSATAAGTSATTASNAATTATTKANAASTSATTASNAATTATQKATAAGTSATTASNAATTATTKASEAATSATTATTKAGEAAASATTATQKATAASESATAAATSASNAASAKTAAETAKTAAETAQAAAEAAAAEAEAAVGIGIATTSKAGIVKPDGSTINVAADGTIKLPDSIANTPNKLGDISLLSTTVKTDTVSAINELNQNLDDKANHDEGFVENLFKDMFNSETLTGVTITNNGNGTYTINGTAEEVTVFKSQISDYSSFNNLKLVGCPVGGHATDTFVLRITSSPNTVKARDVGNGIVFDASSISQGLLEIRIAKNVVCNNLIFKPMLTTNLNATYNDFVPYNYSRPSLRADVDSLNENLSKNLPFITIHPTYGNGTFQDIVDTVMNTKRPVTWSNWSDNTNFPTAYISGMAYPSVDSSNIMFLGRCIMATGGGTYSGYYCVDSGITWQKLVTENDIKVNYKTLTGESDWATTVGLSYEIKNVKGLENTILYTKIYGTFQKNDKTTPVTNGEKIGSVDISELTILYNIPIPAYDANTGETLLGLMLNIYGELKIFTTDANTLYKFQNHEIQFSIQF